MSTPQNHNPKIPYSSHSTSWGLNGWGLQGGSATSNTTLLTTGSGAYVSTSNNYNNSGSWSAYSCTGHPIELPTSLDEVSDLLKIKECEIRSDSDMILYSICKKQRYKRGEFFISNHLDRAYLYSILVLKGKFEVAMHNKIMSKSLINTIDTKSKDYLKSYIKNINSPKDITVSLSLVENSLYSNSLIVRTYFCENKITTRCETILDISNFKRK